MKTYSFEKLDVWQESRQLAVKIYKLTKSFPDDERFGLVSQMRRSSISISSNIAEGTSRYSGKDQIRYYEISYGSLMELLNQLIISGDLEMLSQEQLKDCRVEIDGIAHKLTRLSDAQRKKEDK
jgi:four helix bundle protein